MFNYEGDRLYDEDEALPSDLEVKSILRMVYSDLHLAVFAEPVGADSHWLNELLVVRGTNKAVQPCCGSR